MPDLPSGTLVFTDVEGSTRLLEELGDRYAEVLSDHRRLLRATFERHDGVEVDSQGDAFFAAFGKASDAVAAAVEAHAALAADGPIRVRIGIHTGEPACSDGGYVGIDVHRATRIAAAGHGGQTLVSQSTGALLGPRGLRDLGDHQLKDVGEIRLYQVGDDDFPPVKSMNQTNLPLPPTPLVDRERKLDRVEERSFDVLAASLRADARDLDAFLGALAIKLGDAFPEGTRVERRGLIGGGRVRSIEIELGPHRYRLESKSGRARCSRARIVRDIVLKNEDLGLDEWIASLAADLEEAAATSERGRVALERLLRE